MTESARQRILHCIDSGGLYGAETMLVQLAARQIQAGLTVNICSLGVAGDTPKAIEQYCYDHHIPVTPLSVPAGFSLKASQRFMQFIEAYQPQVVHTHGYKPNVLLALQSLKQRSLRRLSKPQALPRVVSTLHGWVAPALWSKVGVYEYIDRWALTTSDAVAVVASQMLRQLPTSAIRRKAQVVVNGIQAQLPADSFSSRKALCPLLKLRPAQYPDWDQARLLCAVGRLSTEKQLDKLIHAFALLKQASSAPCYLLIIGDGPERIALQQLSQALSLGHSVIFAGFQSDAYRFLPVMDLLIMTSATEGMPMTVLEAMRAGIAIATTAVGELPAVLQPAGEPAAGWLFANDEPDTIATDLYRLIEQPAHLRQLGQTAHQRFLKHYTADQMLHQYQSLYNYPSQAAA